MVVTRSGRAKPRDTMPAQRDELIEELMDD